jgi:hypothetical protein
MGNKGTGQSEARKSTGIALSIEMIGVRRSVRMSHKIGQGGRENILDHDVATADTGERAGDET